MFGCDASQSRFSLKVPLYLQRYLSIITDMDLTEPGRAFSGSLTMPVLRALDGRSQPASAAQVSRIANIGTPAGVRRALERLSFHGICTQEELGGRTLYSLNYKHVLYPAARHALDASDSFLEHLKSTLSEWKPAPVSGVLFGSAARHDGDVESDIDMLLVRPPMKPSESERSWAPQVHELRAQVRDWTGNHLQVLDWTVEMVHRYATRKEELIGEIAIDGRTLCGTPFRDLLNLRAPT